MRGWYLMHRGWMESGDFKPEPFTEPMAFVWSIEMAAHAPHDQWFKGVRHWVERGQFVTSYRSMAKAFGWSLKRTIAFTCRMEKCGKWARAEAQPGKHGPTLLTVCNYSSFQSFSRREETGPALEGEQQGEQRGNTQGNTTELTLTSGNELQPQEQERSRSPNRPYAEMIAMWSEAAALKGWKPVNPTLSDARKRGLAKIFDAHGLDGWREAIQRALDSEYLGGPDPPGWFHFNFFSKPENFLNTKEGSYDKSFGNRVEQRSSWLDARDRIGGELPSAPRAITGAAA